jgi:competence ComEA-like helix-hairpin-helix protein
MKRQRASVLVGLLWCLALLAVVVIGVLHMSRLDLMVVKNQGDTIQAHYLALAGIEKAKALLYHEMTELKRSAKSHSGALYDAPEEFREIRLGRGQFSVLRQGSAEDGGRIVYGIADEESRLNVNVASSEQLAKIEGLTPEVIAAIQDWRDGDNGARALGAEAEYYVGLPVPYLPRNGPAQTMRELLMVRGISRDLLFREDANCNGFLDPEEDDRNESLPVDNADGVLDSGWSGLLTIDSSGLNESAAGQARINIKSADERTLSGVRGVSPDLARTIVAYRNQKEFENIADLLDVTAVVPQPAQSSPPPSQNRPSGQQSPTPSRSASGSRTEPAPTQSSTPAQPSGPKLISEDMLIEMGDEITAEDETTMRGAININTASVEVLMCLPGVSRELAHAIVAYRKSAGFFPNPVALLKVDGMTKDIFKQLAPRVCTRSQTYRIIGEGTVASTGARKRVEMVVRLGAASIDTLAYREDL